MTALRSFEAVARHLSFTKAAAELNVTHAAVSQQVKALEEWLGLKLFKRKGPRITLTDVGFTYFQPVHDAFDGIATATNELRKIDAHRPIEFTTTAAFASRWVIPRLVRFQTAHPEILIKMMAGHELLDFERDNVDIGIRYGDGNWPGIDAEPLIGGELVPLCSPKLLEGEHPLKTPDDLRHHTIIHDDFFEWDYWLKSMGVEGIDLSKGSSFSNASYAYQAAIEGLGVYMGVSSLVGNDIDSGRLVMPFGNRLITKGRYYIIARAGLAERPAVKIFREWLRAESLNDDHGLVNGLANSL